MARLQEQMKSVISSLVEAKNSREKSDDALQKLIMAVDNMGRRMETVERQLASNAPTIEEFITIKHKIAGGGFLAKWAWVIGGVIIALIYNGREAIRTFFMQAG